MPGPFSLPFFLVALGILAFNVWAFARRGSSKRRTPPPDAPSGSSKEGNPGAPGRSYLAAQAREGAATGVLAPVQGFENNLLNREAAAGDLEGEPPLGWNDLAALVLSLFTRKALPVLYLAGVVSLAAVPPALVMRDRWLETWVQPGALDKYWLKVPFLVNTGLPAYFATIILCCLLVFGLVFLYRKDKGSLFLKLAPAASETAVKVNRRQFLVSQASLGFSMLAFLVAVAISLVQDRVNGGWFLLALTAYVTGWGLQELPLEDLAAAWKRNRDLLLSLFLAHIALILLMRSLASPEKTQWIYGLLLALAGANLVRHYRRIPAILWVMQGAVVLYTININQWAFGVVGDDFAFYDYALQLVRRYNLAYVASHLFDGLAVYGSHPFFSSVLQAVSMVLLGSDNFGWRFSSLYLTVLSVGLFYLFYERFAGHTLALWAAFFLACSSYIMSFGKIGYNNLQALFALGLVLSAAAWAIQSRRSLAYVATGLSLALCFYVYPAAIYSLAPAGLLFLFYARPRSRVDFFNLGLLLASFSLLLLPLLLQPDYWQAKLPGLWTNNPEITQTTNSFETHLASNALDSVFAFLYIPQESHFVAVSHVDPLSGVLILIGLAWMIKRARRESFAAYFLAGLVTLILVVGVSHDRRFPPNTRMFLFLPWYALLAAVGLSWIVERWKEAGNTRRSQAGLLSLILVGVVGFNLYQAYPLSRLRSAGMQSTEIMYLKVVQHMQHFEPELEIPKTVLFITSPDWGIEGFYRLQQVYEIPAYQVQLDRIVVQGPELPPGAAERINTRNTLVILQPNLAPEWAQAISSRLSELGKQPCEIKESTGRDTRITLWLSPDIYSLCTMQ